MFESYCFKLVWEQVLFLSYQKTFFLQWAQVSSLGLISIGGCSTPLLGHAEVSLLSAAVLDLFPAAKPSARKHFLPLSQLIFPIFRK